MFALGPVLYVRRNSSDAVAIIRFFLSFAERFTDSGGHERLLAAFMRHPYGQVLAVELVPGMPPYRKKRSRLNSRNGCFGMKKLFPAKVRIRKNLRRCCCFFGGSVSAAVEIRFPTGVLPRIGLTLNIEIGFFVVVILDTNLARNDVLTADKRLYAFFAMRISKTGRLGIGYLGLLPERLVRHLRVGNHQFLARVGLFKKVVHARPLHPAGNKVQVGLTKLADIIYLGIAPLETELEFRAAQPSVDKHVVDDIFQGFVDKNLVTVSKCQPEKLRTQGNLVERKPPKFPILLDIHRNTVHRHVCAVLPVNSQGSRILQHIIEGYFRVSRSKQDLVLVTFRQMFGSPETDHAEGVGVETVRHKTEVLLVSI